MKKVLVKWSGGDLGWYEGFHIMPETAWLAFKDLVDTKLVFPICIGVGMGETIHYSNVSELRHTFSVHELSDMEAQSISSFFTLPSGDFPCEQLGDVMYLTDAEIENYQWMFELL